MSFRFGHIAIIGMVSILFIHFVYLKLKVKSQREERADMYLFWGCSFAHMYVHVRKDICVRKDGRSLSLIPIS